MPHENLGRTGIKVCPVALVALRRIQELGCGTIFRFRESRSFPEPAPVDG